MKSTTPKKEENNSGVMKILSYFNYIDYMLKKSLKTSKKPKN